MINLTGAQEEEFEKALIAAFPSKDKMGRMLEYRLSKNLEAIALGENLSIITFRIIQTAKAEGWRDTLIARAREANPGNPLLAAFCQKIGLSPQIQNDDALERILVQQNLLLDAHTWRQKLGELENQICRVEVHLNNGTASYGTGFLISGDLLLTNYHVMESVIDREARQRSGKAWATPQNVILRFDYKVLNKMVLNHGTEHHLAADWLVDSSPLSNWDQLPPPKGGDPNPDELDYALLRLKDIPGEKPVGISPEPGAPGRGWVKLPEQEFTFTADSPLLILQHPKASPLKLALETRAILGLNGNRTRLTYRTNTEQGSSGSPCFSLDWELVAMHHAGDPDFSCWHRPEYNQGIPIYAIMKLLVERGKLSLVQN